MDYEEAIKTIKIAKAEVEWNYPMSYQEAFDIAIGCIEKCMPKKPKMFIDRTSWVECYACPTCKEMLGKGCGCVNNTCNQRIDWSGV